MTTANNNIKIFTLIDSLAWLRSGNQVLWLGCHNRPEKPLEKVFVTKTFMGYRKKASEALAGMEITSGHAN
jgi:hypothetical protein